MKQLCIVALLLTNISFAIADDLKDFNQQTQGWEWLFTEKREYQKVSYPIETNYVVFENHPNYRVRGRFVYDKSGKLIRVAYLLSNYYKKWNLSEMLSDYNHTLNTLINSDLRETIHTKMSQVVLPKKCISQLNSWEGYYWDNIITMDNRGYKKLEELDSPNDNPLPRSIIVKVGKIVKENRMPLAQKKLTEVKTVVEQVNHDTSVVTLYMIGDEVYARCNQDWLESKRNETYQELNKKAAKYCEYKSYGSNDFENYWNDTNREYRMAEKWLLDALLAEDYKNNKYNVNGTQTAEVLTEIEERLGIRKREVVVKDKETERREMMTAVCEMLGIKYQNGINMLGMSAQLRKLHPTWSEQYIRDQITQTTFQVAMTMGLAKAGGNRESCPEADKYIAQLTADRKGEYTISNVERMDDVTFKIHFDTRSPQRYAVIVKYYSEKPYSFMFEKTVVKD
jgi:hypothetical protein